jgi:hypothetical protein
MEDTVVKIIGQAVFSLLQLLFKEAVKLVVAKAIGVYLGKQLAQFSWGPE